MSAVPATAPAAAPSAAPTPAAAPSNTSPAQKPTQAPSTTNAIETAKPTGSPEAPPAQTAEEKKIEAAIKKFKLKVDKQEYELGEDDALKFAQLGLASEKRFQEAAQMRKQAEQFITMLKQDPASVLSNPAIGVNLREFAEKYLLGEIQKETLTPEQRKIQEQETQLKQYEEERKQQEQQRQQQEYQQLQAHYEQTFDNQITSALSTSGLPKTPATVKRMTHYMELALRNGLDLEPQNVVELVRQDYVNEVQSLFGQSEGDALLQLLGDGVANKIRKADLARLKMSTPTTAAPSTPAAAKEDAAPSEPKPMNVYEWREMMDKKFRGGK
jgi:GGDEF domain-containing protein